MSLTEEDKLYAMSDDELEVAYQEALASDDTDTDDVDTSEVIDSIEDTDDTLEVPEDQSDEEEIDLEEEEEAAEQSDQDSETEEGEEESELDNAESTEGEDEDTLEEGSEEVLEEATVEPTKEDIKTLVKAAGREYEFTKEEMLEQFPNIFGKSLDYTKKMQAIKPYRKAIDAMEQAGISHEDLNVMIDAYKGDKGALTELLKKNGVDALDLSDEEAAPYVPQEYGRDESTIALSDVIDSIKGDVEYETTKNILGSQWDEASWSEITKRPNDIKLLHIDVQSGMYDKVAPIMNKMKVYGGASKSDLEYYKEASKVYFSNENSIKAKLLADEQSNLAKQNELEAQAKIEEVRAATAKRESSKKASVKRKAAATTKSRSTVSKVTDYLADDDEKFDEWYAKLEER